jgi:hypothetical protein
VQDRYSRQASRSSIGILRQQFEDEHLAPRGQDLELPLLEAIVGCPLEAGVVLSFLYKQCMWTALRRSSHLEKRETNIVAATLVGAAIPPASHLPVDFTLLSFNHPFFPLK